jgi:hypothetical protein
VFVVLMVIVLLTGLGSFAMRSASLASLSSGYSRQLTQTHYVSDLAVYSMTGDMARSGGDVHRKLMLSGGEDGCEVHNLLTNPTCARFSYDHFETNVVQSYKSNANLLEDADVSNPSAPVPGSLGIADLQGDMRLELTDFHPSWPPIKGNDTDASKGNPLGYAMVTVTATGQVRPRPTGNACDVEADTAAGVESSRAHVIIGPVMLQ